MEFRNRIPDSMFHDSGEEFLDISDYEEGKVPHTQLRFKNQQEKESFSFYLFRIQLQQLARKTKWHFNLDTRALIGRYTLHKRHRLAYLMLIGDTLTLRMWRKYTTKPKQVKLNRYALSLLDTKFNKHLKIILEEWS